MYQKERLDKILEILKENRYVTVKYLTKKLNTSNATVNRDLNLLENRKTVMRSYGGVEICEDKRIPLEFRYSKERIVKRKIAKIAAELICDGDFVFIGSSTTIENIGEFLSSKEGVTVMTSNLTLASHLSECGVATVCTGGSVVEPPNMLGGIDAVRTVRRYNFDKMFFSAAGVNDSGIITETGEYCAEINDVAMANSKQMFFLVDHTKINVEAKYIISDFSQINGVISDYDFSEATKMRFPNTVFYKV